VYASIKCIGVDGPRHVRYMEVVGLEDDICGYHAYDAEDEGGAGPP